MKFHLKLFIGLLFTLTLTGCIGEDYDVGVPTAHLYLGIGYIQLTEANINWKTQNENVHETIEDVQEYGFSQH